MARAPRSVTRHDSDPAISEAPETLEGWYVMHDSYHIDWSEWASLDDADRNDAMDDLKAYLIDSYAADGDSAAYRIIGQKADLLFLHYRTSPQELEEAVQQLRARSFFDILMPAGSYLSVVEASLYEATARARGALMRKGLNPGSEAWDTAFTGEIDQQRQLLEERVHRPIPGGSHLCWYPMSKRRGEHQNWYDLSMDERRDLMRGHGALGRKFHDRVTQVISGSTGLDDWEWAVDLHADDPLVFKKLVYEMRFDPVSARYAEFGTFVIGLRQQVDDLTRWLLD